MSTVLESAAPSSGIVSRAVSLIHVDSWIRAAEQVRAYRAGHVLGAAMFMVEIAGMRVLYTGDYSRQPDRHLSAADLPDVRPDIGVPPAHVACDGDVKPLSKNLLGYAPLLCVARAVPCTGGFGNGFGVSTPSD